MHRAERVRCAQEKKSARVLRERRSGARVRRATTGVCKVQARHDRPSHADQREQAVNHQTPAALASQSLPSLTLVRMHNHPHGQLEAAASMLRIECFGDFDTSGLYLGGALAQAQEQLLHQRLRSEERRMRSVSKHDMEMHSVVALARSDELEAIRPPPELPDGVATPSELCRQLRQIECTNGQNFELVGCLDIQRGSRMPGEFLGGRLPEMDEYGHDGGKSGKRAYIFNLATATNARRLGIADTLMCSAHSLMRSLGVEWAYVHAECTNPGAIWLYEQLHQYEQEAEEDEYLAETLQHERRRLFRRRLVEPFGEHGTPPRMTDALPQYDALQPAARFGESEATAQ